MKLNHDFAMSVETILYLKDRDTKDFIQAKQVAKTLNFSVGYLQKVVQTLSRHGILECKRGRIGGIRIRAKVVTLLDLWQSTSGGLEFASPPMAVMEKPLKAFRDALSKIIIYKRK
jgi:DNA-binding IscR family transcriptional regulator